MTPEVERKVLRLLILGIQQGIIKPSDLIFSFQAAIDSLKEECLDCDLIDDALLASRCRIWIFEAMTSVLTDRKCPDLPPHLSTFLEKTMECSPEALPVNIRAITPNNDKELKQIDSFTLQHCFNLCRVVDRKLAGSHSSCLCFIEMICDFLDITPNTQSQESPKEGIERPPAPSQES